MSSGLTIQTSDAAWLKKLAAAYKSKVKVILVDDARLGIDPLNQTLLEMGRRANLSPQEWIATAVALGMSITGAWLIVVAALDPEPWSKVGLAISAGALLTASGGFSAIYILTKIRPPNVRVSQSGVEICWHEEDK